jgi:hypothetical protein
LTSNWTNAIPTDDGHDGDKVYMFNGVDIAVEVPNNHIDHKLRRHFTISTWMKHTYPNTVVSSHKKGNKEHLLCMSDGDGKLFMFFSAHLSQSDMVSFCDRFLSGVSLSALPNRDTGPSNCKQNKREQ